MKRIIGEHFKLYGQPKRPFGSPRAAKAFLERTRQAEHFKVYHCKFCGQWHLGSLR